MKFRNQFLKFGGYQEQAQDGAQPTGGSGGNPAPAAQPPATPPAATQPPAAQFTPEQLAAAAQFLQSQNQPPATPPAPSQYQQHVNTAENQQKAKDQQAQIEQSIKFNGEFSGVLTKYKNHFPERTANLLSGTYESETSKAEELRKFAAKDFFLKPENLAMLPDAQQLEVKAGLIADHQEITMSGADAWKLVSTALHFIDQKADQQKLSGAYGNENTAPENVQKFHDRIYPKNTISL